MLHMSDGEVDYIMYMDMGVVINNVHGHGCGHNPGDLSDEKSP